MSLGGIVLLVIHLMLVMILKVVGVMRRLKEVIMSKRSGRGVIMRRRERSYTILFDFSSHNRFDVMHERRV